MDVVRRCTLSVLREFPMARVPLGSWRFVLGMVAKLRSYLMSFRKRSHKIMWCSITYRATHVERNASVVCACGCVCFLYVLFFLLCAAAQRWKAAFLLGPLCVALTLSRLLKM